MQEQYIDDPDKLERFCAEIADSGWLALDTEFIREKTYHPQLCLLQVANEHVAACIDPLALADLSPLLDILYRPETVKVFHAARQDLEVFFLLRGEIPSNVFDTQIAAALGGLGDQIGYAALVKQLLGVHLDKAHSRTDWCRRPLDEHQLRYALDDVIHLGGVYKKLSQRLAELGRLAWVDPEHQTLTDPLTYRQDLTAAWQRIRGKHHLKGVQLAVLAAIASWREEQAQHRNKPRGWVLRDDALIDIARRRPQTLKQLSLIRGIDNQTVERDGEQILGRIEAAVHTPRADWPDDDSRPHPLTPEQEALTDVLMGVLRLCAARHRVSTAILANRRDLEKLVLGERELDILKHWRRELAGGALLDVLEGRVVIRNKADELTLSAPVDADLPAR